MLLRAARSQRCAGEDGEDVFYYLSLCNENYHMPVMPNGVEEGIFNGVYRYQSGPMDLKHKAHIFGSGPILFQAIRAHEILAERYGVSADGWSATSYKALRTDVLRCRRWNILHPTAKSRKSYVESALTCEKGAFVAVSDNIKTVPDQIAPWLPGGLVTLGTDGVGRNDTRKRLRRFFEVDAECIVVATLYSLAQRREMEPTLVAQATKDLGVDPEKVHAQLV